MQNKKQKLSEAAAEKYTVAVILGVPVSVYAAYRLMTHHQVGSCYGSRSFLYPQFAIPMLALAAWILLNCIQYNYALRHPKYEYKGLRAGEALGLSILLGLFSVGALFFNNFCIPF